MTRGINSNLAKLPPYLFVELDRKRAQAARRGMDIIDLGIGDPDTPTPQSIVDKMAQAVRKPEHHRYPTGRGSAEFRAAVARYMKRRFNVSLDPDAEVLALIGSKEGIGHLPLALLSPGDSMLVPDPGYPPYYSSALLANAVPVRVPVLEEDRFLPDFDELPHSARLMILNYPNNPTGAVADLEFFSRAVDWAKFTGAWLAHDAAYVETYHDDNPCPSILQVPGAVKVAVEFHSLSKTYQMTGWRVGWACGNEEAIQSLARVKNYMDSGVFTAIQEAAAWGLDHCDEDAKKMRQVWASRHRLFADRLKQLRWKLFESRATFYIWGRPPQDMDCAAAATRLLDEAGIVATPGSGFGPSGEGCLRFSLTQPEARLNQALDRLSKLRW